MAQITRGLCTFAAWAMAATLTIAPNVSAQEIDKPLAKGKMLVGGSAMMPLRYFSHGASSFGIRLSPRFGYMLSEGWEIGAMMNLDSTLNFKAPPPTLPSSFSWSLGPAVRYYFPFFTKAYFYLGFNASIGFKGYDFGYFLGQVGIPLGFMIPLSPRWMLDIGFPLTYNYTIYAFPESIDIPIGQVTITAMW